MMTPDKLVEGKYYFLVMYFTRDLDIPVIKTYIYLGKNLYPEEFEYPNDEWYFQEAESYQKHGSFLERKGKKYDVISMDEGVLDTLYDLKDLINVLEAKL